MPRSRRDRVGDPSPQADSTAEQPGDVTPAGQLDTQQPALVPASGKHVGPQDENNRLPRSGDRDLDVNGIEQDDDGQPGTGLGPEDAPTDKER
jgi:hypothetical protein